MWFPLEVVAIDPKFVVGLRQQSTNSGPSPALPGLPGSSFVTLGADSYEQE